MGLIWEKVSKLKKLDCFIKEVLRLYPPAWMLERDCFENVNVRGVNIPKGESIAIFVYSLHRNEKFWDDAKSFKPSRWESSNFTKGSYLPFGLGPRMCIGAEFAILELKVLLLLLIRKIDFKLLNNPVPFPRVTLKPKNGIIVEISERKF